MRLIFALATFTLSYSIIAGAEISKNTKNERCELTYFSKRSFYNHSAQDHTVQQIEKNINESAKKITQVADKIDQYTLGLVSMVLTGGRYSLEQMTPTEWGKVIIRGDLLYSDQSLTTVPMKGAKIILSENNTTLDLTSSTDGSFQENLYKLVPYKRLRLFPYPVFEMGQRRVATFKVPFRMTVESPTCNASIDIRDLPLEANVFLLSPSKN